MARSARPPGPLSLPALAIIVAVLVIDQASKAIALASLPFASPIPVLPVLDLYLIHNPGIAFSFLAGFGSLGLIALTAVITVVVLAFWVRATDGGMWATVGYALIIGGAVGNLIDRLAHGYVIDFLLLRFGDWVLFVFNLADVALTFGPIILLCVYLWPQPKAPVSS
jgi:signal peptidase II